MRYATTILIWLSLLVCEMHTWFTEGTINGMQAQWYMWFSGNSIWAVLMAAALVFYQKNKINTTTVKAYLLFCIADTVMFFYDFKQNQELYKGIYTFLLIAWILIYNYGSSRTTNRQGTVNQAKWAN